MKLKIFWVVTIPNKNSTIEDIVFVTNSQGLVRQVKGGLTENEMYGIYTEEYGAIRKGRELLELHKKVRPDLH